MMLTKRLHTTFILILTGGLVAACTPPPTSAPGGNLALDMRRLQADVDRQERLVASLELRLEATEERLEQQSARLDSLGHESARQGGQRTTGYAPYTTSGVSPEAAGIGGAAGASPTEVYLQAFGDYASGSYLQAIQGFQTFLQRFPNNSYASNAQFWLGDCYFNQQDYANAIQTFEQGLAEYPRAPKNPDALLKIATAHLQLGNTEEARLAVETLTRRYPESTAAKKAADLVLP